MPWEALCLPALATLGKGFSPHFRFLLPIREAQKPASYQNHQNTQQKSQQNPLNPMAGTARKPQCIKSHPGAATARYRRCPGTSGIPPDTEHVAGPALCRTHGATSLAEPSAQPHGHESSVAQQDIRHGEPSPCQHWCCPHHKPPDRIREAGQSFNYSWLPGAKQLN